VAGANRGGQYEQGGASTGKGGHGRGRKI